MDQNSSNGSGPDKRNWRERLGIGAKEMPKLADEFRDEPEKQQAPAEALKPAPRAPQPVMKTAPMAPRAPARPVAAAAPVAPAATSSRAMPRLPDNATQEALAEKLRAQRAAAERLAEQRVQAARERAEGKAAPAQPVAPVRAPNPPGRVPLPTGRAAPPVPPRPRAPIPPPPTGARPKFSFAEEPVPGRETRAAAMPARSGPAAGVGTPLSPPRPALGGERGQPPFLRPAAPGPVARAQPPYRPVEPAPGAPRLPAPGARPSYGAEGPPPAYPGARGSARRPPSAPEAFPRQIDGRDFSTAEADEGRPVPRLSRPAPPRGRAPQDEYDEVFEDEPAPRQRASAREYQSAYADGEDVFGDDERRSSGPWLLLLALLAAALLTGAAWWYFNGGMKNMAGSEPAAGTAPVVSAPEDPAKVAPEDPSASTDAPAARKKQIYDRIVGDQEVGGRMQPTEELPVSPSEAQPSGEAQPADEVQAIEPASGANQIPAPDAVEQGAEGLPTVDEPLPLPPPPAGQEGRLDQKVLEKVAVASAVPEQGATAPPLASTTAPATTPTVAPLPPPEKSTDGAAVVSATAPQAQSVVSEPRAETASKPATVEPEAPPVPAPAPQKVVVPKKKPDAKPSFENLGAEPVVLVPPARVAVNQTQSTSTAGVLLVPPVEPVAPAAPAVKTAPAPAVKTAPAPAVKTATAPVPEKSRKSLFDLFRSSPEEGGGVAAAPAQTQVATAPQQQPIPQQPKPQQPIPQQVKQVSTGSGFLVQLSSFRSEDDARREYNRLTALYPSVVGSLQQRISPSPVGGSTRYQLGLGPLPSRSEATRVCSALITAGESDCIVRGL